MDFNMGRQRYCSHRPCHRGRIESRWLWPNPNFHQPRLVDWSKYPKTIYGFTNYTNTRLGNVLLFIFWAPRFAWHCAPILHGFHVALRVSSFRIWSTQGCYARLDPSWNSHGRPRPILKPAGPALVECGEAYVSYIHSTLWIVGLHDGWTIPWAPTKT